jgi:hypothetical protein
MNEPQIPEGRDTTSDHPCDAKLSTQVHGGESLRNCQTFIEPEGSLPCSQEPSTGNP